MSGGPGRATLVAAVVIVVLVTWIGVLVALGLASLQAVLGVIGLAAVAAGGWKLAGSDAGTDRSVPWERRAIVGTAPEESGTSEPLSSAALVSVIDHAGERAREDDLEAGIAVVRPVLRSTLAEVLVAGGASPAAAETAIENGTWTDDPVAAAVVESSIPHGNGSVLARLREWFFPERAVRDRVRRAVNEMGRTAEETVPSVPGQRAPRPIPTVKPRLEELSRAADGRLSPVVDGQRGHAEEP